MPCQTLNPSRLSAIIYSGIYRGHVVSTALDFHDDGVQQVFLFTKLLSNNRSDIDFIASICS